MTYKIGMDIGSTTIKAVVLNDVNEIVYKSYERHFSRIRECALEKVKELHQTWKQQDIQFCITGSAGMQMAEDGGFSFVQEVFSCAQAVRRHVPDTDVVVELGGEDAKIIYLQGALEERMNSTCAGGTGSFIDQMAVLLHVSLEELDQLSLNYERLYPIASRCGVFAKSDIQPLINQGVAKADLAASIFQAVVDQTITGLAQGRPIEGKVLFLGGPLHFFKGLQQRFTETLHLGTEEAVFPELGPYYVALGAALFAEDNAETISLDDLLHKMEQLQNLRKEYSGLPPLFKNAQEYDTFVQRHAKAQLPHADIQTYHGNAYLGIDAGSTTTKLVLLDDKNQILYDSYQNNQGNPVDIVRKELLELYACMGNRICIKGSAVTGYGEELLKNAFQIDLGVVETIAHYTAAKSFQPEVDFIIDIGGQDMKCFCIRDGSIDDIILNEACSSGCGSFIETFAKNMGYTAEEFAKLGLRSTHPVNLGSRCTVFMNSSVKEAQRNGASIEDISAGLSMSIVKNALYKVIRVHKAEELGRNILVQGGTFLNDTVLRSFEKELQQTVVRPDIAGLMGAYGAALIASRKVSVSTLMDEKQLHDFEHSVSSVRCGLCTNHCALTINKFKAGRSYIAGNKCERPTQQPQKHLHSPNLYDFKYQRLRELKSVARNKKIGIPMTLNMYDLLPFWHAFFEALGIEVVLSDPSSQNLFKSGQTSIPSDTVCFPAKLTHGHIQNLIDKGVSYIFYPNMSYNVDEHQSDNHFNCPVVAYYPELVQANMNFQTTKLLAPYITLENDIKLADIMQTCLHDIEVFRKENILKAIASGKRALQTWRMDIRKEGAAAIAYAEQHRLHMIVVCGRPYHVDPFIHHGIASLLNDLGFVVLSEDSLPRQPQPDLHVLNQWTYHARMYQAAAFVCSRKDADLVQLVSFGCGIDAITSDEIKEQLTSHGKLYTQIKIDEVDNLGAARIRLRSLKEAIEERRNYGTDRIHQRYEKNT